MDRFHWFSTERVQARLAQPASSRLPERWSRWWVAILSIACCVLATSTSASAKGAITDGEVRSIVARIDATGRVSPADRAALLTRPQVAAQIVDPASGVLQMAPDAASPAGGIDLAAATYATRSSSADRYIQYSSITGATVLDYHFTIYWTYNGSIVTSQPQRGHYLRTSAPGIYDRGFTNNTAYANLPGPYAYTVTMQASWEQCILKYGCVASGNPFTQFGVYFDGTYHIVQRQ